jgi:DNA-binding NtrC family response regulator
LLIMSDSAVAFSKMSGATDALVVTRDDAFAQQLGGLLAEDHRRSVAVARSLDEASSLAAAHRFKTVFIDFRKTLTLGDPTRLLKGLGQQNGQRTPVIAISDAGYVCDWAVMADLLVSGQLQLPLDRRQLAGLLEQELPHRLLPSPALSATPKVVRGKSITYKTYSPEMFQLLDELVVVAKHDVTVLMVGETGTGKTTLARLVHELSPRHASRFLQVGCGALPPELTESELFGHVKGAFTSADRTKLGKFDAAGDGTLLLDEIDVLDLPQQAKLLRVIENGEFEPVGSNETRHSQARLIVASNLELQELMDSNRFRADLYYRLNMLECRIPPLRERPHDIVPLTLDFVAEFCTSHDCEIRRVHPDFLVCLKAYDWPGNVRELKNHVRRAVLFCSTGELTPDNLAAQFHRALDANSQTDEDEDLPLAAQGETLQAQVAATERRIIQRALRKHGDNRTAAARKLGMSRVGLYKMMKRHGMIAAE